MKDAYRETYKEEAAELLANLESSLMELEGTPDDAELVGQIFRSLHTIKGSGAMFAFDAIASFTHEVETTFDLVRNNEMPVTKELIGLTLAACDEIGHMLKEDGKGERNEKTAGILLRLRELLPHKKEKAETARVTKPSRTEDERAVTYRVSFRPSPDIFATGTNPLLLLNEMRELGECKIVANLDNIPPLENMNPEECYTHWNMVVTTDQGVNAIRDVFIFVEDTCDVSIEVIDDPLGAAEGYPKKLGEILVERGDVEKEDLRKVLKKKKPIGVLLVDAGLVSTNKVLSALAEQEHVKEVQEKRKKEDNLSSIRVPADKLDKLVDLVGELVTVQARLTRKSELQKDPDLILISEEVERLTEELRDNTMSIRMLPIGSTFGRFKRLVRDLSQELGKEIELTTDGSETELDKTVIERLNDPLVHLIRNSIDHAIEPPDIRRSLGKLSTGTINLSAAHSGAQVVIRITDDGKGLDKEAIISKAIEKGLASPDAELTEKEIFNLIFLPGFSTAKKVTGVSGRGVGMDVVKRGIDALRGTIDVASQTGIGTTVTIRLPLTLAIVDGLLVNIGNTNFVLPLSIVEECVELTREDVKKSHGRNMANIRGEIVPYIRLRDEFGINGSVPAIEQIVVTGVNGSRIGFVVDKVIGEHQTVIKNLGRFYKDVESISGATILGDGSIALIVDVVKAMRNVEMTESGLN
jgi:two-component system, chemotaxis family, sensor kinase CheA